jgi:phage replication-related protein YjqB (UPF0714/DUF867 family)
MRFCVSALLILALLCCTAARAEDKYTGFAELALHEAPQSDYTITVVDRQAQDPGVAVVVIAIHGGRIESGTSELARAVAGGDFSLYTFEGVKPRSNAGLHITSTHFDEPQALALVARHGVCLSLHGCSGAKPRVHVGGRDIVLGRRIAEALRLAGFEALEPGGHGFAAHLGGVAAGNICNATSTGAGVQLELSTGLRASFFSAPDPVDGSRQPTVEFSRFVAALRAVLIAP